MFQPLANNSPKITFYSQNKVYSGSIKNETKINDFRFFFFDLNSSECYICLLEETSDENKNHKGDPYE